VKVCVAVAVRDEASVTVKVIVWNTDRARSAEVVRHDRTRRSSLLLCRGLQVPRSRRQPSTHAASAFAESVAQAREIVGSWLSTTGEGPRRRRASSLPSVTVKVIVRTPTLREAPKSFTTVETAQLSAPVRSFETRVGRENVAVARIGVRRVGRTHRNRGELVVDDREGLRRRRRARRSVRHREGQGEGTDVARSAKVCS
jgi:hypothetical protein